MTSRFTFQYGATDTTCIMEFLERIVYLHSNMVLLILSTAVLVKHHFKIFTFQYGATDTN